MTVLEAPCALVTAGASGIGRAVVERLVRDGYRVHVADIDDVALRTLAADLPEVTVTRMDVADDDSYPGLVATIEANHGRLDAVVNNAGIGGMTAPVAEYPAAEWRRVLDVNLTGCFLTARATIPLLRRSESPAMVIMSSLAGRTGYPNRSAYCASKWGLIGLTKTLARELGADGTTVNAVLPGAVEGHRLSAVLDGRAQASGRSREEETALELANQAIKRFTRPQDVADLVGFLLGPAARTISGESFSVDGGSFGS